MVSEVKLDKGKTALLMADFHTDSMGENPIVRERQTCERAKEVRDAARDAGVFVVYIVVNFRPGFPEISNLNKTFCARKTSGSVSVITVYFSRLETGRLKRRIRHHGSGIGGGSCAINSSEFVRVFEIPRAHLFGPHGSRRVPNRRGR